MKLQCIMALNAAESLQKSEKVLLITLKKVKMPSTITRGRDVSNSQSTVDRHDRRVENDSI